MGMSLTEYKMATLWKMQCDYISHNIPGFWGFGDHMVEYLKYGPRRLRMDWKKKGE